MSDAPFKVREVKCPQCGRLTLYSPENPFRPFCSERCRLIDLGEWATDKYKIPVKGPSSDSLTSPEEEDDHNPEDGY